MTTRGDIPAQMAEALRGVFEAVWYDGFTDTRDG